MKPWGILDISPTPNVLPRRFKLTALGHLQTLGISRGANPPKHQKSLKGMLEGICSEILHISALPRHFYGVQASSNNFNFLGGENPRETLKIPTLPITCPKKTLRSLVGKTEKWTLLGSLNGGASFAVASFVRVENSLATTSTKKSLRRRRRRRRY